VFLSIWTPNSANPPSIVSPVCRSLSYANPQDRNGASVITIARTTAGSTVGSPADRRYIPALSEDGRADAMERGARSEADAERIGCLPCALPSLDHPPAAPCKRASWCLR